MNILVIAGSPKGKDSITLHTCLYLEKKFPQHRFIEDNCASTGRCVYKDGFDSYLRDTINTHDAILYAFRIRDHSMGSRFKMYDFPQKKWKTSMMMYLVGWMMGSRKLKAKMGDRMTEGMIAPYKKILEL